uniref:receptor protein-tyrosine kinase n=1 Tax=Globodera rostochiensis TaxID=31243 RepID=A0A914GWY4_GLORO
MPEKRYANLLQSALVNSESKDETEGDDDDDDENEGEEREENRIIEQKSSFSPPDRQIGHFRRRLTPPIADSSTAMAPNPYDDGLFIEPAGDYDVVFGDYNSTMGDGVPSGKRPYIRLTVPLNNVTRPVGAEVRMRCEAAAAPLPIQFTWLKNLAPVEKNRRTRIRHREMSSKLVIIELDVLDSGYYQCTATNAAGSVNSTAVLKVSTSLPSSSSTSSLAGKKRGGRIHHHKSHPHHFQQQSENSEADYDNAAAYDNYLDEEMKSTNEETTSNDHKNNDNLWRVPNAAGGSGYIPIRRTGELDGRWLDGKAVRQGDCIAYRGEACQQFLAGKHVKVLIDREHIYDAEKDLLAALMTVRVMPGVSEQCRRYSHQVACYHMFKVCETGLSSTTTDTLLLCREDCDQLKNNVCPNEFAMAAQHDLVGDAPKALLPDCDVLTAEAPKCLNVLDKRPPQPLPGDLFTPTTSSSSSSALSHWCFVGAGTKYQGTASTTRSNRPCIYWPSTPNSEFNTDSHPQLRNARNHCRNPSYRRSQFQEPWCYTVSPGNSLVAEPCNVPRCPPNLYPDLDDTPSALDSSNPLASLTAFWDSLSTQSQLITLSSGLGAIAFLLILLFCLFCCRRERSRRAGRRRKNCLQGMTAQQQQQESASSMLSGSVVASQQHKVATGSMQNGHVPQHPHHHHVLVQSCNGGSTITNSDLNSAFYRKVQDERMRAAGAMPNDEMLNPLLPYGGSGTIDHIQTAPFATGNNQPPTIFELKHSQQQLHHQQQQPYRFWESAAASGDTMNSVSAAGGCYPQYYVQQSQKQSYSSPHASTEPAHTVEEPYQISSIHEQQLRFSDRLIGEDSSTLLTLGEWEGGMISGASLKASFLVPRGGVSFLQGGDICAVFDYMIHGDLVEFLKVREPRSGTENDEQERARNAEDFLRIATQIAAGMQYLVSKSFVHRDLAARNCLVADQQVIKIADFARMKPHYAGDYYKLNANARGVPLRWLPREVLNEGKYSEASDVYAFGVCLWEIYTYARQPYERFTDEGVIRLIQEESLLDMPEYCPPAVYAQMVECFNANPLRRPNFCELYSKFQKWLTSGQPSALQMQQHRASSVHSGGSGSGVNGHGHLLNGQAGRMLRQTHPQGATVPSPAPNGSTTILASGGKMAKLALLGNGGASIVHSTPIAQNSSDDGSQSKKRPIPPARRRQPPAHNRVAYTEDEEEDEEGSYSSDESRDS